MNRAKSPNGGILAHEQGEQEDREEQEEKGQRGAKISRRMKPTFKVNIKSKSGKRAGCKAISSMHETSGDVFKPREK